MVNLKGQRSAEGDNLHRNSWWGIKFLACQRTGAEKWHPLGFFPLKIARGHLEIFGVDVWRTNWLVASRGGGFLVTCETDMRNRRGRGVRWGGAKHILL